MQEQIGQAGADAYMRIKRSVSKNPIRVLEFQLWYQCLPVLYQY